MNKIAILTNFLDNIGGAEKLTLALAKELKADIYTTNISKENIKKMGFDTDNIYSIGKVPKNPPLRQELTKRLFKKLDLKKKYDSYLITGDWAPGAALKNQPCTWYTHSALNELWDFYELSRKEIVPWYGRYAYDLWTFYNRRAILKYTKHVKKMLANSENTKNKVRKYLKRKATVIHPPVDTQRIKPGKKGDYWLSINRLVRHKRIEDQLKTFKELPNKKLIIVGTYENATHHKEYKKYLEHIKPKNVEFKNHITDQELIKLYQNCIGLITTSQKEDFGMTVIEAYAAAKPVVAVARGGYLETVKNNKTGYLVQPKTEEYKKAIEKTERNYQRLSKHALKESKKYDVNRFANRVILELKRKNKNE